MDERYQKVEYPWRWALDPIQGGKLKNFTAIDPQWRIEAMTEVYGLCGIGWKYEVDPPIIQDTPSGEKLIFMLVRLYIRDGATNEWSAPIFGAGGDKIVAKNKNGLESKDEALKACLTDALGNAMKHIGVAAAIYRGEFDGNKYRTEKGRALTEGTEAAPPPMRPDDGGMAGQNARDELYGRLMAEGMDGNFLAWWRFHVETFDAISDKDVQYCLDRWNALRPAYQKAWADFQESQNRP